MMYICTPRHTVIASLVVTICVFLGLKCSASCSGENKILHKCSASSTEGVQLLFWQLQHSTIRLQPQRAHFEKALKSQIFYLPSNFSAIYFSSCSPAVRADLNEILPKLFNPHLTLFKKIPHGEI